MAELERKERRRVFSPYVDIAEKEESFVIWADMPGVDKDSIDINLGEDTLTIRAKLKKSEPEGLPLLYREYYTGDYEATFQVGRGIDRDKINAEYKDGVLTITLPKAEEAKPRSIKVKAA